MTESTFQSASGRRLPAVLDRAVRRIHSLRGPQLLLAALFVSLLALPVAIHKPGLPATLKADEPAYFLAALSLVHDFDLRIDEADQRRLFEVYPYLPAENLIVMSGDGWRTLYYGKPYLVSLMAAPFVAVFGVDGALALNLTLFFAMVAMGFAWLRRHNPQWLALFFALGFFLLSTAWSYVFWIHPEILCMFATCACLFFGFAAVEHLGGDPWRFVERWGAPTTLALSAGCLALGVYNKPMLAAMGLPVCIELLRRRRWRGLLTWIAAAVASMALICAGSWLLTGQATAYLVDLRAGFIMYSPTDPLITPEMAEEMWGEPAETAAAGEEEVADGGRGAGWWWLARMPETKWFELKEDLVYFLLGRHTGLVPYMPFAVLSVLLFVALGRGLRGWLVLASAALVALFFLVWIPFNWHGGGGFVGNRYFVMVYPAFLFLVSRIGPPAVAVAGWAVAGWLVGPLVLAPFGWVVANPTLQAHARNVPFQALPLEFSFPRTPGYAGKVQAQTYVWGRKDEMRASDSPGEDVLWLRGGGPVEVWLQRQQPLDRAVVELRSSVAGQTARIAIGDDERQEELGTDWSRFVFESPEVYLLRKERDGRDYFSFHDVWIYRLEVELERGRYPRWDGVPGEDFYRGADLRFLGDGAAAEAARTRSPGVAQ